MRVLVVCNLGMSSSILVKKMKDYAASQGEELMIKAVSSAAAEDEAGEWDVCLVGPQLMHAVDEIAEALGNAKAIAVLDRADSLNGAGGALFTDVASAMYVNKKQVPAVSYIYGIGGRDTTETEIASVYTDLQEIVKSGKVENPYRYLGLKEEK